MNDIPTLVNTLEDLLVQEFRTCQSIYSLTMEERQALSKNDIPNLAMLVEQKEAALDELVQIEDQRRMVIQVLGEQMELPVTYPTIAEIAARIVPEIGGRINRLREGITSLTDQIKIITNGNQSLAMTALERVDALQTILVDTFRPTLFYSRPGAKHQVQPEAVWDFDQRI